MRIHLCLFYAVLFGVVQTITAQEEDSFSIPKVVMPEPSAAEFIRQEAFPVSNFSGTANITIPIYTIKSGDIELPITASYNTGGIKVDQEASWIGLGWNLNAGGTITRVINGNEDLAENQRLNSENFGYLKTGVFPDMGDGFIHDNCYKFSEKHEQAYWLLDNKKNGYADLEPDFFYFNIGAISGKFFLPKLNDSNRNNYKPIIYGNSNVDIQLIFPEGNEVNYKFVITDASGTKYFFNTAEKSASTSYASQIAAGGNLNPNSSWKLNYSSIEHGIGHYFETSTWHLDQVISAKGKIVQFHYNKSTYIDTPDNISFYLQKPIPLVRSTLVSPDHITDVSMMSASYSGAVKEIKYLSKISFENGELDFITDDRSDLYQSSVFFGNTTPQRLKQIQVKEAVNNKVIYNIDFVQDYFNYPGGINNSGIDTDMARLKLDSIVIKGESSKLSKPYGFTYELGDNPEEVLPSKEAFSKDYWGFYNGKFRNQHLIPRYGFNKEDFGLLNGADRSVQHQYTKRAALKSVSYPTKGTATFEYGANIADIKNIMAARDYVSTPLVVEGSGTAIKAFMYYVSNDAVDVNFDVVLNPNGVQTCNSLPHPDTPEDEFSLNVYAAIIHNPDANGGLAYLKQYKGDVNANEDQLIEIDPEGLDTFFETHTAYNTSNVTLANFTTSNLIDLCNSDPVIHSPNLKLNKGWHLVYVAKPETFGNGTFDLSASLYRPTRYESDLDIKYGPGLRIERQILDSGVKQEETNYTYEVVNEGAGDASGNPSGILMNNEPVYSTRYLMTARNIKGDVLGGIQLFEETNALEPYINIDLYSNDIGTINTIVNKDVVGYDKVTVSRSGGFENGKSIYYYELETFLEGSEILGLSQLRIPINQYENGNLLREEHYTAEDVLVSSKEATYRRLDRGGVKGVKSMLYTAYLGSPFSTAAIDGMYPEPQESGFCTDNYLTGNSQSHTFYYKEYFLNAWATVLEKETETTYSTNGDAPLVSTTEYLYDDTYLLPVQTTTYISKDNLELQKDVTFTKYPFMYNLGSAHNISLMASRAHHLIQLPIEVQQWRSTNNGDLKLIGGQLTEYNHDSFSPTKLYAIQPKKMTATPSLPSLGDVFTNEKTPDWVYTEELELNYDSENNLDTAQKRSGSPMRYYWAYNKTYPVIEANNASSFGSSISGALAAVNYNTLDALLYSLEDIATNSSQQQRWRQFNEALRTRKPEALITTYTYAPLIGITSKTDARGYTTYYEYDALNRLKRVRDAQGNVLSENKYNYKN